VFLVAGPFAGKTFIYDPLRDVLLARTRVATPRVILSSEVKLHPGDEGDTFSVAIRFRYSFRGATYESGRCHFEPGSSSDRAGKERIASRGVV
jgi:hypothetical protein